MDRPSLLYLTHRVPFPPNRGDRIRTYNILRFLAERADVSLVACADEPVSPETLATLRSLCRQVELVPIDPWQRWLRAGLSFLGGRSITVGAFHSPAIDAAIARIARSTAIDRVLTSSSAFAQALRHPSLNHIPAWVDLIDVDSQKWRDYAQARRGPKAWIYGAEARRLEALEAELATCTRGVFVVSETEADLLRAFCPSARVEAIGNGVDVDFFAPREVPTRPDIVFVGVLDYLPNVDAAVWFGREIWPAIHAARPDSRFRIVGRSPAPAVQELASVPGIDLIGPVPDVRPYVAEAQIVAAPLRIARGVQNKILEAMAMGKPVISTSRPLQGLALTPGVHCLTADAPAQWRDAVHLLLDQPLVRSAMGAAAWSYTQTHHRWEACLAPLQHHLNLPKPSQIKPPRSLTLQ